MHFLQKLCMHGTAVMGSFNWTMQIGQSRTFKTAVLLLSAIFRTANFDKSWASGLEDSSGLTRVAYNSSSSGSLWLLASYSTVIEEFSGPYSVSYYFSSSPRFIFAPLISFFCFWGLYFFWNLLLALASKLSPFNDRPLLVECLYLHVVNQHVSSYLHGSVDVTIALTSFTKS